MHVSGGKPVLLSPEEMQALEAVFEGRFDGIATAFHAKDYTVGNQCPEHALQEMP